jgi:hypothetical protein
MFMIGPSKLLLVITHLFAILILHLWVRFDVKNIFAVSHTEHHGSTLSVATLALAHDQGKGVARLRAYK